MTDSKPRPYAPRPAYLLSPEATARRRMARVVRWRARRVFRRPRFGLGTDGPTGSCHRGPDKPA